MNQTNFKVTGYNKPLIARRADPFVLRDEDGTYYFTASVPEYDRIVLRHADSVAGLAEAEEKTLWVKHEQGPQSIHIWAPELHRLFGGWYLYYAAGEKDDIWKIRPYVLHCKGENPMEDEWEELGRMQPKDTDEFSFRAFSLDATVFEHRGEWYYVWAEKTGVGRQISNLYIAKMESPNKLATEQVLLTTPDYDWERINFWVNEGPAVLKHQGKIFLTYSASSTGACYCMGMLTAEENADLLDPHVWKKERMPVLATDPEKGIFGPGHNCFTKAEDGKTDLCIYHARQYDEITGDSLYDPNRHTYVMKITYDRSGNPVFFYQEQKGDCYDSICD